MTNQLTCQEVEELLFEWRRDELSDIKHSAVDHHLASCPACQDLADKLGDALDLAARGGPQIFSDGDDGSRFAEIAQRLDGSAPAATADDASSRLDEVFAIAAQDGAAPRSTAQAQALFERISDDIEATTPDDQALPAARQSASVPGSSRWRWAVLAAAMAALVAGAYLVVADQQWPFDASTAGSEQSTPPAIAAGESGQSEGGDELREPGDSLSRERLESQASGDPSTRIFASEDADFVASENHDSTPELRAGQILVEYLARPDDDEQPKPFAIDVGQYRIAVVGTVFAVSAVADPAGLRPQVTVYEGTVTVTDPAGTTQEISKGQALFDGEQREVSQDQLQAIAAYVDLAEHRRKLHELAAKDSLQAAQVAQAAQAEQAEQIPAEEHAQKAPAPEPDRETSAAEIEHAATAEEQGTPSSRSLRESALQAQHHGDYDRAASLLATALEQLDPTDQAAADVLLELATLHHRQLDNPGEAAQFMRQFLTHWPDDPASAPIRRRLCEIDGDDDQFCN